MSLGLWWYGPAFTSEIDILDNLELRKIVEQI